MGTQQILMIVLSVIVVGAAVAVGIQMFDTQSTNQMKNMMAMDMMTMAMQAQAYWRTPIMMTGAGYSRNWDTDITEEAVTRFIDYRASTLDDRPEGQIHNPNANYTFTVNDDGTLTIRGISKQDATIAGTATVHFDGDPNGIAGQGFERGIKVEFDAVSQ
jgi:hypothetical protein